MLIFKFMCFRYYRCANKKNSGCLATASMENDANINELVVHRQHNHPPDKTMEVKYLFEMELTKAACSSSATIKTIYNSLADM